MKLKSTLLLVSTIFLLTGCNSKLQLSPTDSSESTTTVGPIEVTAPEELTLLDNKDVLSADGLYYATWVAGDHKPYENSDEETIDLYDAQLYFLTSESKTSEDAQNNCDTWLAAAKAGYNVESEETVTYNNQAYTVITYKCIGDDTPYDHGVSAFSSNETVAVCAEFTCTSDYTKDLLPLLTEFLNNCNYNIH